MSSQVYDAAVIGGGPAGATAALILARAGARVAVLDRATFPHFHIGESFLPRNFALIRELGLDGRLAGLPQVEKRGAAFVAGHGRDATAFSFAIGLLAGAETVAFNIERAPFDAMLLAEARGAGAEVREGAAVKAISKLEDGDVRLVTEEGEVAARWLVDASGQATVVGRHLGTRRVLPHLRKVAYFGHFRGVERAPMPEGGYIVIVMCREGWFWSIPLDEERTSLGLVMNADEARKAGVPPTQMLAWGLSRCPEMRRRTATAVFPESNHVAADFSYRCAPYAGPGYFLAGDAATFMDPIFSTGVCLGMMSGREAAQGILSLLRGEARPERVRRSYVRSVEGSSEVFFRMVRLYYEHSFRELFLEGQGPLAVHRAVISILAGHVFPRPVFSLRWRMRLFELFVAVNRVLPLVPRREDFSLLASG